MGVVAAVRGVALPAAAEAAVDVVIPVMTQNDFQKREDGGGAHGVC